MRSCFFHFIIFIIRLNRFFWNLSIRRLLLQRALFFHRDHWLQVFLFLFRGHFLVFDNSGLLTTHKSFQVLLSLLSNRRVGSVFFICLDIAAIVFNLVILPLLLHFLLLLGSFSLSEISLFGLGFFHLFFLLTTSGLLSKISINQYLCVSQIRRIFRPIFAFMIR